MRPEPKARGRCHDADYWDLTQILSPDVDCPHPVAMVYKAAPRAVKHAARDLASHAPTPRTRAGGVGFLLQKDLHPDAFGLVGEFLAHATVRPLMDFLIVSVTNIRVLPKIAYVANDQRLHACLMQRGNKSARLLVLDLVYLILELLELSLLGTDDPSAPLAAFLHAPVDTSVEFGLQLVAVLHLGAQEPSVENVGMLAVMSNAMWTSPRSTPVTFPGRNGPKGRPCS